MNTVPVFDTDGKTPLMPTTPSRARRWVKEKKATYFWRKGIFCVRLNQEPSGRETQEICVGIDPGAKYNGMSIKSSSKTYFNVQYNAIDWVKGRMKSRARARNDRRMRNTPYRKRRSDRSVSFGTRPSIKARWQQHVNLVKYFSSILPITHVTIEDVKATTRKGCKKWNQAFSPIEYGKNWFYAAIKDLGYVLNTYNGYETFNFRKDYGLTKSKNKSREAFNVHAVDAWVLANQTIGGHTEVDNKDVLILKPLKFYRRQLHFFMFKKGHIRPNYGGTLSMGIKRGTLVRHVKHGLKLVGGSSNGKISLHQTDTNKRIGQGFKVSDIKILTNMKWNMYIVKDTKVRKGVSKN